MKVVKFDHFEIRILNHLSGTKKVNSGIGFVIRSYMTRLLADGSWIGWGSHSSVIVAIIGGFSRYIGGKIHA